MEKARKRARRHRGWGTSLASLGGVAAAFVLLVNTSVPFAMACARIPGLRELTAAAAFSPSPSMEDRAGINFPSIIWNWEAFAR